jgi:hypothetical protein
MRRMRECYEVGGGLSLSSPAGGGPRLVREGRPPGTDRTSVSRRRR